MDITNIPPEMRKHKNWVAYRFEMRKGNQTKVPYQLKDPRTHASTTDPDTWGDFEDALEGLASGLFDGIGFVFTKEIGITGIDIDKCINDDGVLANHALDWVERCNSYTEISPSGKGLHIYVFGKLEGKGFKRVLGEIYDTGRFFTVTGNVWGEPCAVKPAQSAISYIAKAIQDDGKPQQVELKAVDNVVQVQHNVISMFCADVGCNELWHKRVRFPSQNEYDLAIATRAYMRGFSADEAAELIYQHRLKWNENPEKGKRSDYIQRTLEKAANVCVGNGTLPVAEPEPVEDYFTDGAWIANHPKKIKWLVKNYIPQGGMIWLFGMHSSYKTFVALDLVYHIALGLPWRGNRVKQGNVIYVAGEGVGGLGKRLKGLVQHYKRDIPEGALKITKGSVFLNEPVQMAAFKANLRAAIEANNISIVVIDTKSANMQGSDSDAATMNDWINVLRQLEIEFGVTIVVIDHVGHGDQDRMRGASQQGGAADAAYRVQKPDAESNHITFSTYKDPKDFESPPEIALYPQVVQLTPDWNDEDGEPTTTLVMVQHRGEPEAVQTDYSASNQRISPKQVEAAKILKELWFYYKGLVQDGDQTLRIERKEWVSRCRKVLGKNAATICESAIKNELVDRDGDVHVKPKLN